MIDTIRGKTGATIRRICSALSLPRSSYYQASKPTKTEMEDQQIGEQIERIFRKHLRRYGYRRIHDDLKDLEIECGPARVRRIMKERGLHAIQPKNYIPRTSDGRADQPSSNLLLDRADPTRINEVWVGDITFIPTSAGGVTWQSSWISAHARLWAGVWPTICVPISSLMLFENLSNHVEQPVTSFSTATVAANTEATYSEGFSRGLESLKACRDEPIPMTTLGLNLSSAH
jgi:hypothetical protein